IVLGIVAATRIHRCVLQSSFISKKKGTQAACPFLFLCVTVSVYPEAQRGTAHLGCAILGRIVHADAPVPAGLDWSPRPFTTTAMQSFSP
ncbi:MAG TPA: hypothetical protein VE545_02280, partial [Candidatus Dormibacteraeota bacterium]|nr:hypothetical protein [Candidatus Dormibacteraeota bacterium]